MTRSGSIRLDHPRFGRLEIPEWSVFHFEGIPGFPQLRRAALLDHDRAGPYRWLVGLDAPDLAFVVTDPRAFFPSYDPPLVSQHLRAVGARTPEQVELVGLVAFRDERTHLNLAAPLLLNPTTRQGAQAILERCDYSTREPLPALPEGTRPAAASAPTQIESKPQT